MIPMRTDCTKILKFIPEEFSAKVEDRILSIDDRLYIDCNALKYISFEGKNHIIIYTIKNGIECRAHLYTDTKEIKLECRKAYVRWYF